MLLEENERASKLHFLMVRCFVKLAASKTIALVCSIVLYLFLLLDKN